MTVHNFNWFLHALLFLHTERVIKKQQEKAKKKERDEDEDEEEEEGINIEGDEE
jgi:hypothetical protein